VIGVVRGMGNIAKFKMDSTIENRKSKISGLPLKLGIAVVLLFALVIATCLLWATLKVRYYSAKLYSNTPKERVAGVDGLLGMGRIGSGELLTVLRGKTELDFLAINWKRPNAHVEGDGNRRSPLHIAAEFNYLNAARFLIDKGANVNAKDLLDQTPLHRAVGYGKNNIVALLLEKGAEVNAKDNCKYTPLHWAANKGYKDITVLLIGKGANVNAVSKFGETPTDWAAQYGHSEIADLLRSHGAKTGEELRRSTEHQVPSTEKIEKK